MIQPPSLLTTTVIRTFQVYCSARRKIGACQRPRIPCWPVYRNICIRYQLVFECGIWRQDHQYKIFLPYLRIRRKRYYSRHGRVNQYRVVCRAQCNVGIDGSRCRTQAHELTMDYLYSWAISCFLD